MNDRERSNPNVEDEEVGRSDEDMAGRGEDADADEEFEEIDSEEDDEEDMES